MRRRRGETSLFEILSDPSNQAPGRERASRATGVPEEEVRESSSNPRKGFWAKVKGLGSSIPTPDLRGDARARIHEPTPEDTPHVSKPGVSRSDRPRRAPRSERLPELEPPRAPPPVGLWGFFARTLEVRIATLSLYAVGVLLALFLTYQYGRNSTDPLAERMRELENRAGEPSYSPKLHLVPKKPIRKVESKKPVPRAKSKSPGAAKGDGKQWGIIVCEVKDLDYADNLLDLLGDAEKKFGARADIQTVKLQSGQKWFRLYFGPFSTRKAARELLDAVRALPRIKGNDFTQSYVREVQTPK